jgi:gentisate 1,2-dioxygenase
MPNERTARLAETNFWDELIALRDRQRADLDGALQVINEEDLPLEVNRQGLMRWYMHPSIRDTVLSTVMFFEQEIPPGSRSGRLKFQGNQIIMVLEGAGYTMLDGVKHAWKAGDVINLPLRENGIVVQHFNPGDVTVKFVASEMNWFECSSVDRGCGFEQLEDCPEYRELKAKERRRG